MKSFHFKSEYNKLLTPEVVAYLTQIHEYKGQQNLFIEAKADALSNFWRLRKSRAQRRQTALRASSPRMTG